MRSRVSYTVFSLVLALFAAGCGRGDDGAEMESDTTAVDTTAMDVTDQATAQLSPTQGNNVSGTVTFTSENGGVRIEAHVTGLAPGKHGIHVHQNGDCSAPDASSAGDHFQSPGQQHGAPDSTQRHTGDLGNMEAGQDSTAHFTLVDSVLTLSGPNSVVGKAVVVHEGEDDLATQPSGDSGARVACGVVQMAGQTAAPSGAAGSDTSAARY